MLSFRIFTVLLFVGLSLAVTLNSVNCTLPRVRYRWGSLTTVQQQTYLTAVSLLKAYQEIPYPGAKYTRSLYDIFSLTHSSNEDSTYAHGTAGFFPWHRHYMWTYETALQEMITIYNTGLLKSGAKTGFLDACVTVPYWDWENDFQKEAQSVVWSSSTFGSYKENSCVTDGVFANWAGADGYCLWRSNDVAANGGIAVGVAQIISYLCGKTTYQTFQSNIQNVPHGSLHMWIGGDEGAMGNMWSPDDPLFFVHHSNIDRFWTLWQDCYEYDKLTVSQVTSKVFPTSWQNPDDTSVTYYKTNPMPYTVDLDGSTFPSYRFSTLSTLPTDMFSIGLTSPGFNGMYYRYGPDPIVTSLKTNSQYKKVCTFDNWVNYTPPTTKRSLEQYKTTSTVSSTTEEHTSSVPVTSTTNEKSSSTVSTTSDNKEHTSTVPVTVTVTTTTEYKSSSSSNDNEKQKSSSSTDNEKKTSSSSTTEEKSSTSTSGYKPSSSSEEKSSSSSEEKTSSSETSSTHSDDKHKTTSSTHNDSCIFERYKSVVADIEKNYPNHHPTKKLKYLALYECSDENKINDGRNYSVPLKWCKMNKIDPADWKTVCQKEGWFHGYKQVADLEESRLRLTAPTAPPTAAKTTTSSKYAAADLGQPLASSNQAAPWVLPVSITAAVIFLVVLVLVTVYLIRRNSLEHF